MGSNGNYWHLVGSIPTPLKNISLSVGIIIPNIWKIKNVPNHHPNYVKYNGNRIGNIMGIKWE
jgi:hypothetical protein